MAACETSVDTEVVNVFEVLSCHTTQTAKVVLFLADWQKPLAYTAEECEGEYVAVLKIPAVPLDKWWRRFRETGSLQCGYFGLAVIHAERYYASHLPTKDSWTDG